MAGKECNPYRPMPQLTLIKELVMTTATIASLPTVIEFIAQLDNHDWTYMYASGSAYFNGSKEASRLRAIAAQDDTLKAVYTAYNQFVDGKSAKPVESDFIVQPVAKVEAVEVEQAANDGTNNPEPEPTAIDLTREKVAELVADGRFFSVSFIKRTTGDLRTMQARMNVTKHLKGGVKPYSDKSKNLLTVFSVDANGYRSIPIDAIQSMKVKGQTYVPATAQQLAA